jgi:hypothetical protein
MCNTDVSLRGTNDYVSFGTMSNTGLQCRDLDTIQNRAFEHRWDYEKHWNDILHIDTLGDEKDAMRQKLQLEKELGRKIPYDQLNIDFDEESGNISLSAIQA